MKKTIFTLCVLVLIYSCPVYSAFSVPASEGVKSVNDSAIINQKTVDTITLKSALLEFKSLNRQERKARIKEAKATLKEYKAQKASGTQADTNTILLVILAILLPPLAVYLHENAINGKFWLSLLLTLLFWIPGVIYALIVVLT